MELVGYALAALIGLSLGLLGGGGSILAVPVFVYVLGFAAKEAVAMSLPLVGTTSLVGSIGHWRAGNVNLRAAGLFALFAVAGAFAGARLASLLTGAVQLSLFAVIMLVAAGFMFRGREPDQATEPGPDGGGPELRRPAHRIAIPLAGIGVGLLTGLVGVGGGFLIVPALVLLARLPMKTAVGTSLVVIAANAFAGASGYVGQVTFDWRVLVGFTLVAVLGAVIGARLVRVVAPAALRRGFASALVLMGGFILYQNRRAFGAEAAATGHPESIQAAAKRLPNGRIPLAGILTAGQPTGGALRELADAGVATVIDLRPLSEQRGFDEPATARAAGLGYHNVPVTPETLDDGAFRRVRRLLQEVQRPVLLHCSSGNRAAAVLLPYLVLDQGMPAPEALKQARAIGLKTPKLREKALDYIERQTTSRVSARGTTQERMRCC